MYYVYLLQSAKYKHLYAGCTRKLRERIIMHNQGRSEYTKKYTPWKLIYFEGYLSKQDAYRREKALKTSAQGFRRLRERLGDSLQA